MGVLSPKAVHAYGVSGPIARASGVDFDLRRDEPYLAYGELQDTLKVVTREEGDCLARFECLLEQTHNSLDLADACLDRLAELPPGPVNQRLPKVLKAPEGHTYAWTENPLGINGYYLVSKGEKTPYRLKLRSASFNNIQALAELLPGTLVADMVAILGSLFFVVGDIDKQGAAQEGVGGVREPVGEADGLEQPAEAAQPARRGEFRRLPGTREGAHIGRRVRRRQGERGRAPLTPRARSAARWVTTRPPGSAHASSATCAVMSHEPSGTGAVSRPSRKPVSVPKGGRPPATCA